MNVNKETERARKHLGRKGERLAVELLKKKGMRILEKNYRCPAGEVDIIAATQHEIVFVEVKTRSSTAYGWPEQAVNREKQATIKRVARYYLSTLKSTPDPPCRFDIISVLEDAATRKCRIDLFENAF